MNNCVFSSDRIPIWGGRFQPPHLAHEYISQSVLSQFTGSCIAIVNPDPSHPPVPPDLFPRFAPSLNPLTFFERLVLWSQILQKQNMVDRAIIVPTWHPRVSVVFDNAFLPPESKRFWVVPAESDEELMKVRDFEQLGETVFTEIKVPRRLLGISSSEIRNKASKKQPYSSLLPVAIRDLGLAVVQGGLKFKCQFTIFPLIGELPSIQDIINCIHASSGTSLIVAIPVNIGKSADWWFQAEAPRHILTYYERSKLIFELFSALNSKLPLITPLLYRCDEPVLYEAFLPNRQLRSWLLPQSAKFDGIVAFMSYAGEPINRISSSFLSHPNTVEGQDVIEQFLGKVHFHERGLTNERKNKMSGVRFGKITVVNGNVINVEGNQTNFYGNEATLLVEKVNELLRSIAEGRPQDANQQANLLERLKIQVPENSVRTAVDETVKSFCESNPTIKSRIKDWAQSFAISAAGSGLVAMIQEAIHALH